MEKFDTKNGVSVRAYKGDAMTLLCFDLDKDKIKDFTGFSIRVTPPGKNKKSYFLFNRISYSSDVLKKTKIDTAKVNIYTMDNAPLQRFSWIHTPGTNHNINKYLYGEYTYAVTPRYLVNDELKVLDNELTVSITIDVNPYKSGNLQISFTRGFIESQAYFRHFGLNNKTRPNKTELLFDIKQISGPLAKDKARSPNLQDYTFEDQHKWLGWQARTSVIQFLDDTLKDDNLSMDVFAFDLNEPFLCDKLIQLGKAGRVRIILDNSTGHTKATSLEPKFAKIFRQEAKDKKALQRGKYLSLSHSKIFIQKRNGAPKKVLTGSTNFSTNGLYINANHVLIFDDEDVAKAYQQVFDESFGISDIETEKKMKAFKKGATQAKIFRFESEIGIPNSTIRFSPHSAMIAKFFFEKISKRITNAETDLLFAVMNDRSKSSILDSIHAQVRNDKIFSYGITDVISKSKNEKNGKGGVLLYKPNSKKGVLIAGKPGVYLLPQPFESEPKIPGISVHHKFVVVDFKGTNPVVYCGSSNLAFGPEQSNGDNLIEINDRDVVTVFAIEAIRLVDHFEWRNALKKKSERKEDGSETYYLHGSNEAGWVNAYYNSMDLRCMERELFIKKAVSS